MAYSLKFVTFLAVFFQLYHFAYLIKCKCTDCPTGECETDLKNPLCFKKVKLDLKGENTIFGCRDGTLQPPINYSISSTYDSDSGEFVAIFSCAFLSCTEKMVFDHPCSKFALSHSYKIEIPKNLTCACDLEDLKHLPGSISTATNVFACARQKGAGQKDAGQNGAGQLSAEQNDTGQMGAEQQSTGQNGAGQTSAGQNSAGQKGDTCVKVDESGKPHRLLSMVTGYNSDGVVINADVTCSFSHLCNDNPENVEQSLCTVLAHMDHTYATTARETRPWIAGLVLGLACLSVTVAAVVLVYLGRKSSKEPLKKPVQSAQDSSAASAL